MHFLSLFSCKSAGCLPAERAEYTTRPNHCQGQRHKTPMLMLHIGEDTDRQTSFRCPGLCVPLNFYLFGLSALVLRTRLLTQAGIL